MRPLYVGVPGAEFRSDRRKCMPALRDRPVLTRIESLDDRTAAAPKLVWPGPSEAGAHKCDALGS
jgi:hypothetical protein